MSNEAIESLNFISDQFNRYLAPIIFLFGTFGNILNCLVLSQPKLRSNSCALFFLVSSFIDLISILVGLPTRILAGWHLDPTNTMDGACKTRVFIVFSTRTIAIWLITLATIDRWLISSIDIRRRQMSNLKNVKREVFIIVILSILFHIHMFPCYEANNMDAPLKCYEKIAGCRLLTDLTYVILTITIPLILMTIFGLLTISHVHHLHTRVVPTGTPLRTMDRSSRANAHSKKTDRHLLRMLILQIFLLIVLCIPQAIQKLYITVKPFGSGSELEDAIKTFLYNIEILLAFMATAMPFYIYVLAGGSVFRKASMNLLRQMQQKITC
ncbi:unnamed protein product [Rotaria sp. Silwood1]|nr:unnamed protein product [Rotaria sp. Silwood1]CAF1181205.1 unnamed protein product [Rotaria sp. Silwood1]CAF3435930.1 unnamed protein product [Rotaria sp. Silwood1]CAF3480523.1 unnamed protein product [Rotaria sp. Silwood1]CAF3494155.1 unnamed protein product [Rotaria sp. Silwood1]